MTAHAKRVAILFVILAILGLPATTEASEGVVSYKLPVQGDMYYGNCAPEGGGEVVVFEGTFHVVLREDVSTPGGVHQNYHDGHMGVQGTGLTTGKKYLFVGGFNLTTNWTETGASRWEYTIIQTGQIISQGSGDNQYLHVITKLTVVPGGEAHAEFQFVSEGCKG
jgi:hypothetical protein